MVEFFAWRFKDGISDYLSEHNSILVMENTKDAGFHDEVVYNVPRIRLVKTLVESQYSNSPYLQHQLSFEQLDP